MNQVQEEPRTWDLTRLPQQQEFVWDRSKFAIWQGGRGSTKTFSGMVRMLLTITDELGRVRPEWRHARILVAAPVLKQLQRGPKEVFDEVFDDTGLIQRKVNGHSPRRELADDIIVYFFNVGPQGEGAEAWRGSQYAIVMLDEAAQMPEKAFNQAMATLRQKNRNAQPYKFQCIITTTPLGENWLWHRFLNTNTRLSYKDEEGNHLYPDNRIMVMETSTKDAIRAGIMEPDYASAIGYKPGTLMWEQEVEGKVIRWAGLVFEQGWRYIGPENPPPEAFLAVYGAIDVGTIDPTAIIVCGIDLNHRIWVLREYYKARADFADWADKVGEWTREFGVRQWFVDSELTVRLVRNARIGVGVHAPYKAKDAAGFAINYLNGKIKEGSLSVHPSCIGLISEMSSYAYKAEFDGDDVTFLQKVKTGQPDHAIDALRYCALPLSAAKARTQDGAELSYSIG